MARPKRDEQSCACGRPLLEPAPTDRVVTLVHGTFAKHADWIQDGQPLPQALTESGGVLLDRFCWSGKNRHRDRLEAGEALRDHLVDLVKSCGSDGHRREHHVIAHSHGGNVALYALRERGDEATDELLRDIRVTTLATPFITMRRRPLPARVFVGLALLFLGAVPAALIALPLQMGNPWSWWIAWTVTAGLAAVGLAGSARTTSRGPGGFRLRDIVTGKAVLAYARAITARTLSSGRLLVLRGLGDEAAGVLGGAHMATWIMSAIARALTLGQFLKRVLQIYAISFLFVIMLSLSPIELLEATTSNIIDNLAELGVNAIVALGIAMLLLIVVVIPALVSFANLPFGTDTLIWNFFAQTTAEPVPLGSARIVLVTQRDGDDDDREDMSHTLYDDPPAMRAVLAHVHRRDIADRTPEEEIDAAY
jgi:hypothetical protein